MEKKIVVFGFVIIILFFASVLILDMFPAENRPVQEEQSEVVQTESNSSSDGKFNINIFSFLKEEMGVYYDENGKIVVEDVTDKTPEGTCETSDKEVSADDSEEFISDSSSEISTENGRLEVHFIDVGQGSCTLIVGYGSTGVIENTMLIDAGYYEYGTKVQNYIQKLGITSLDYIIGTHPDSDHIGAMDVIVTKFDCGVILLPEYQRDDIGAWYYFKQAMEYKHYTYSVPSTGSVYSFGDGYFTVLSPGKVYEECNDNSIVIKLQYGDTSFLFPGDAEEIAETDMVSSGCDLSCDVYQVSHHGSNTSTSQAFLDAVSPRYAVISCGEGNDYYHPHGAVLNRLRAAGVEIFRTDEQGSVVCVSDGVNIVWNCAPSTTWQAGQ